MKLKATCQFSYLRLMVSVCITLGQMHSTTDFWRKKNHKTFRNHILQSKTNQEMKEIKAKLKLYVTFFNLEAHVNLSKSFIRYLITKRKELYEE